MEGKTAASEYNKVQMKILSGLDTRAKLRKMQESKIREHYSRVFKNENNSLAKQGINTHSSIGTLSKTRKKQGFLILVNLQNKLKTRLFNKYRSLKTCKTGLFELGKHSKTSYI